jgi:hypothetical protein
MLEPLKAAAAGLLGLQDQFEQPAGARALAHLGRLDPHRQDQP